MFDVVVVTTIVSPFHARTTREEEEGMLPLIFRSVEEVVGKSRKGDNKDRGVLDTMTSFTSHDAKVVTKKTVMDDEEDEKRRAHIRATCERSPPPPLPPLIKK